MENVFLPHKNCLFVLNFSLRIVDYQVLYYRSLILFNIAWKYVEWMWMDLSVYY